MTTGNLCAEQTSTATASSQNGSTATSEDACITVNQSAPRVTWTVYGPESQIDGFAALQAEWNPLLQRSRFNTIFLTYEWQTTWWQHLGTGDLWIVAMRRADTGELVGIAPFYLIINEDGPWVGQRKLNLVGCIEVSDYLDVIAAKGYEGDVYAALADWLQSEQAPEWDLLDLCNLPQDSLTYQTLPALYSARGFEVALSQEDTAPQFSLPLRYESYLQEVVEKKQRHEIRRKQRRAEREATVGFHIVGPDDNLNAEMDDFVALQQASREDKAEFMTPEMRRFFGAMAHRMQEAGYLRLCFLTLDGEKAAALLAFEYNHRFLLYNSGYDPDAHSQLSPGWVLLAYGIQYAIAVGCTVFDFMQGEEEYKYRFGSHDYAVMRVMVHRRRE
jgi:CelD/BcsL family acetyltransferase involved in cellulose biosynthesis